MDLLGVEKQGQGEEALQGIVLKAHRQGHHQGSIKDVQEAEKAKPQAQGPLFLQGQGGKQGGKAHPEGQEAKAGKQKP